MRGFDTIPILLLLYSFDLIIFSADISQAGTRLVYCFKHYVPSSRMRYVLLFTHEIITMGCFENPTFLSKFRHEAFGRN